MPIHNVERPGFREMLSKLKPCYEVPSHSYVSILQRQQFLQTLRSEVIYK